MHIHYHNSFYLCCFSLAVRQATALPSIRDDLYPPFLGGIFSSFPSTNNSSPLQHMTKTVLGGVLLLLLFDVCLFLFWDSIAFVCRRVLITALSGVK